MHSLRHTFATRCIEAEMKPKALQYILGHSRIEMTMNLYVHVTGETVVKEMEKFELAMRGRKAKIKNVISPCKIQGLVTIIQSI